MIICLVVDIFLILTSIISQEWQHLLTPFSHLILVRMSLLRSFHTFGPEIALNPHGLTLSTGEGGFGGPEGRVQ